LGDKEMDKDMPTKVWQKSGSLQDVSSF